MIVEKQMECRMAGETEVLGENLPQRHFCPSQNPTWPDPGLNPGRRGGKLATNRLSYGAAYSWDISARTFLYESRKRNTNKNYRTNPNKLVRRQLNRRAYNNGGLLHLHASTRCDCLKQPQTRTGLSACKLSLDSTCLSLSLILRPPVSWPVCLGINLLTTPPQLGIRSLGTGNWVQTRVPAKAWQLFSCPSHG
jgi:hypothetical protein